MTGSIDPFCLDEKRLHDWPLNLAGLGHGLEHAGVSHQKAAMSVHRVDSKWRIFMKDPCTRKSKSRKSATINLPANGECRA